MGGQIKDKEQPFDTNKISVIGNIVPNSIELNEEKGYAKYLVMISSPTKEGEAEKKPEFYNFIQKLDDQLSSSLKEIIEAKIGKQVKVNGSISYSKVNKDNEVKYYNNFNAFNLTPTTNFLQPKASIELTGVVNKALQVKEKEEVLQGGEVNVSKFGYLSIKTLEGKEGNITKYHNIGLSQYCLANSKNFLESIKEGESISIKARLSGNGDIKIAKDSQVVKGKNFEEAMTPVKNKSIGQDI